MINETTCVVRVRVSCAVPSLNEWNGIRTLFFTQERNGVVHSAVQ